VWIGENKSTRANYYGKGKVVPVLNYKHHATKTYWGMEIKLHAFLTSALAEDEWSTLRSGLFTPRETASGTHWIGGWVSPRTGMDAVARKKILHPLPELEPPIIQPVAQRYTTELSRLLPYYGKGRVKVKLSLCLTKHHAMKTYWVVEV
jgi:hypothetical protein